MKVAELVGSRERSGKRPRHATSMFQLCYSVIPKIKTPNATGPRSPTRPQKAKNKYLNNTKEDEVTRN